MKRKIRNDVEFQKSAVISASMAKSKYLTWSFFWMVLIQYVLFKISWLVAAWGAIDGPPWSYWGALPFLGFLGLHVLYTKRLWELWFALSVAILGTGIDSIYNATGLIDYNGTYPVLSFLGPIWITAMWAGLAVCYDHSLKMLIGRPVWTFAVGAIFGPLAYLSGKGMGAIRFAYDDWTMMAILAAPWGFKMLLDYWLLELWRPKPTTVDKPAEQVPVMASEAR
jgi:hypothetical protein